MNGADVREILALLRAAGAEAWVGGGWGIDTYF
ncbi:nucleotidyltransferase domain-containing protein [Streptomyces xiamenensis]